MAGEPTAALGKLLCGEQFVGGLQAQQPRLDLDLVVVGGVDEEPMVDSLLVLGLGDKYELVGIKLALNETWTSMPAGVKRPPVCPSHAQKGQHRSKRPNAQRDPIDHPRVPRAEKFLNPK